MGCTIEGGVQYAISDSVDWRAERLVPTKKAARAKQSHQPQAGKEITASQSPKQHAQSHYTLAPTGCQIASGGASNQFCTKKESRETGQVLCSLPHKEEKGVSLFYGRSLTIP
jgi:hypothetical protein